MITWDSVVLLAPSLEDVPVDTQNLILAQVEREVPVSQWGSRADDGRRYLAAHLGSLYLSASASGTGGGTAVGPVQSETVGPVSRTFAIVSSGSTGTAQVFDATTWGQEFARLRALLPTRFGLVI